MTNKPDINPILSRDEWKRQCEYDSHSAFYYPPDKFLFHHYDESNVMMCEREKIGNNYLGDIYAVTGITIKGYCGQYSTQDVAYYIKSQTWIEIPSDIFFATKKVEELRLELAEAEIELSRMKI